MPQSAFHLFPERFPQGSPGTRLPRRSLEPLFGQRGSGLAGWGRWSGAERSPGSNSFSGSEQVRAPVRAPVPARVRAPAPVPVGVPPELVSVAL